MQIGQSQLVKRVNHTKIKSYKVKSIIAFKCKVWKADKLIYEKVQESCGLGITVGKGLTKC